MCVRVYTHVRLCVHACASHVMRVHVSVQLHRPERGIWCLPLWPLPPSYCFETIGLSLSLKLMDLARPAGQWTSGILLSLLPSPRQGYSHSHIPHPDFDVALGIQIRIFMLLRQTFYQLSWLPSPSFVCRITIIWFKRTNGCFFCSWLYPKHSFSYVLFHSALYAVDRSSFWDICIYLLWFSSSSLFLSRPILFNSLEQSSLIRVSLGPGSFFFWTPHY